MDPSGGSFRGSYVVTACPAGTDPSLLTGAWATRKIGGGRTATAQRLPAPPASTQVDEGIIDFGGCAGCGRDDLIVK